MTILYTAPTAIRAFMRQGDEWPGKSDLSSLRLLGTVGEPINPEAWVWYHKLIGGGRCPVVDTWWQTETGAIMMTTLPGAASAKPGSTGLPMFGVLPEVVTQDGNAVPANSGGLLVLRKPWPTMLRTVWGDDERFLQAVLRATSRQLLHRRRRPLRRGRYFWVVGRIDDVLNVAGHRIGHRPRSRAPCVRTRPSPKLPRWAAPTISKGQALVVFVSLRPGFKAGKELTQALGDHVGKEIGKFAKPDAIRFTDALPKTREWQDHAPAVEGCGRGARSRRATRRRWKTWACWRSSGATRSSRQGRKGNAGPRRVAKGRGDPPVARLRLIPLFIHCMAPRAADSGGLRRMSVASFARHARPRTRRMAAGAARLRSSPAGDRAARGRGRTGTHRRKRAAVARR